MGQLRGINIINLIEHILNTNFKGHLHFKYGENSKKLFFENKFITGSSSNDPTDYLGQYLINEGVISLEQFNRAYKTELETEVKMAAVLNMIGLAPVEKLTEAMIKKIVDTVFLVSCWNDGTYELSKEYPLQSDVFEIKISCDEIRHHHQVRHEEFTKIINMFSLLGANPEISILDRDISQLKKLDQQIINLLSIGKTIKEMLDALPVHFYLIARHMYKLFVEGILLPGKGASMNEGEIFSRLISISGYQKPQEISDISKQETMDIYRLAEEAMNEKNYWKAALYYRVLLNINPHNIVFRDSLNNAEYNYTLYFYKKILPPTAIIKAGEGEGIISDPFEESIYNLVSKNKYAVRDIVNYFSDKHPEVKILNSLERLLSKKYIVESV